MNEKFSLSGPPYFDAIIGKIHIAAWRYPDADSTEFMIVNRYYETRLFFTRFFQPEDFGTTTDGKNS